MNYKCVAQNRSGLYMKLYNENEKELQRDRRSIVTTCGEEAIGHIDTDLLLAFCTGDDLMDDSLKNMICALKQRAVFTEICEKVTTTIFWFSELSVII